jgi:hypothetical protein
MAAAQAVVREHQEHHLQVFFFFNCANIFIRIHYTDKKENKMAHGPGSSAGTPETPPASFFLN